MPIETMEEKDMRELERKPFSLDTLRVRCPHCRKLYMVQMGDVSETKPRFECVQCHSRFWLSMADMDFSQEVTGIPVQMKEAPKPRPDLARSKAPQPAVAADLQPCPKCFKPVQPRTSECPHCGVMISKLKELSFNEGTPAHSEALGAAWRKVVGDYANESTHAEFLRLAQRERNLAFAGAQYGQMNKLMATDEITKKRLQEVQALAGIMLTAHGEGIKRPRRQYARIWQVPLAAATMMMVVGLFLPVFRNMVGVGAAILFIALAVQIQTRRRT